MIFFSFQFDDSKEFEHVESEWPIFYLFMIIDGFFKVTNSFNQSINGNLICIRLIIIKTIF